MTPAFGKLSLVFCISVMSFLWQQIPCGLSFLIKKKASLNYKAMQYPFQAHTLLKKKLLISIIVKIM